MDSYIDSRCYKLGGNDKRIHESHGLAGMSSYCKIVDHISTFIDLDLVLKLGLSNHGRRNSQRSSKLLHEPHASLFCELETNKVELTTDTLIANILVFNLVFIMFMFNTSIKCNIFKIYFELIVTIKNCHIRLGIDTLVVDVLVDFATFTNCHFDINTDIVRLLATDGDKYIFYGDVYGDVTIEYLTNYMEN